MGECSGVGGRESSEKKSAAGHRARPRPAPGARAVPARSGFDSHRDCGTRPTARLPSDTLRAWDVARSGARAVPARSGRDVRPALYISMDFGTSEVLPSGTVRGPTTAVRGCVPDHADELWPS